MSYFFIICTNGLLPSTIICITLLYVDMLCYTALLSYIVSNFFIIYGYVMLLSTIELHCELLLSLYIDMLCSCALLSCIVGYFFNYIWIFYVTEHY